MQLARRKFKAESQRLLDLMINSIYTHKEIFLRELISNASDAMDKMYYKALTEEAIEFNRDDFKIMIEYDKDQRILKVSDSGIGMTEEELADNLGTIAKSGTFDFKNKAGSHDGIDIIGQFGVGFYASFMVASEVRVISRAYGSEVAHEWISRGADGYTIGEAQKEEVGTEIIMKIKENTEDDNYDEYLTEYGLRSVIKKYSDFIRYPIMMPVTRSRVKEGTEDEYESYETIETVNSMVPIWKKNKEELTQEDYRNFYQEKHYGFDEPLKTIHYNADGMVSFNAILYIPKTMPFDYYTKEYEKGLELYSKGVLIMNKSADLLPDYFSFVKGMVDSEDLSLNISREILQKDQQLKRIAKNIQGKIKKELVAMLEEDRDNYKQFFETFGRQLKYGIYDGFGVNKDELKDLVLFHSSTREDLVSLKEYVEAMAEDQKYIYYASGDSLDKIKKMPQTEMVAEKGYEILYFTEDVDEFAIRILSEYEGRTFKSVSGSDLGFETEREEKEEDRDDRTRELFDYLKDQLKDKVKDVRISNRLKHHPVCLANEGEVSIEMEKILNAMPNDQKISAEKVLEININHEVYGALKQAFDQEDLEKVGLYAGILYNQALLIEGLPIEDPLKFTEDIVKIMK